MFIYKNNVRENRNEFITFINNLKNENNNLKNENNNLKNNNEQLNKNTLLLAENNDLLIKNLNNNKIIENLKYEIIKLKKMYNTNTAYFDSDDE